MKILPLRPKKDITKRLSKSKLNNFCMCPKQYWFNQYYPELNTGSEAMTRGKELHDILELIFKISNIKNIKDFIELLKEINIYKHKKLNEIKERFKLEILKNPQNKDQIKELREEFKYINNAIDTIKYQKELKLFWDWQEENGFIIPESCEEKVYDKELDMVAIWDRVDYDKGKRILIDYKSGKKHPIKKFKDELLFYAYIYKKHKKLEIDYVGIYFIDHGFFDFFPVTEELVLDMLVKYLMENKDKIKDMQKSGIWTCKRSFLCPPSKSSTYQGCPFKEFCSGYNKKW